MGTVDGRTVTCLNNDNLTATFGRYTEPFFLEDCDGVYEVSNNVSTSDNTMTDGATYLGSVTKLRNIVLTLRDRPSGDHRENRTLLYNLFKPKSAGTLTYKEDDIERQIDYYVESVSIGGTERSRQATVSLICPDPFFVDPDEITVILAGWDAQFEFEHEFVDGGEELGVRVQELSKTIENTSAAENIGLTITIEAEGAVTTPTVTHVEQEESITVGTDDMPYTMAMGDKIIITTGTNNKHVYEVVDGVQTEINEYLTEDSEFFQLMSGDNTIGFSAVSGEDNMIVTVSYQYRYLGC